MKSLVALLLCLPLAAMAESGLPNEPYVYVEGRAEVEKPADMVTLRFELSSLDPTVAAANTKVQKQANQVFALLKKYKIAEADVLASDLHSAEERAESELPNRKGELLGYRVSRPFSVEVHEIGHFPRLVEELLALGISEFSGISEGLADHKKLEEEVWEKAVANARERAEKIANPTGAKVGTVFAISPIAFPQILPNIFGDSNQFQSKSIAEGPGKVEPTEYRLAPVGISQSVHIIYLLNGPR